jgi:hypothetical protein
VQRQMKRPRSAGQAHGVADAADRRDLGLEGGQIGTGGCCPAGFDRCHQQVLFGLADIGGREKDARHPRERRH